MLKRTLALALLSAISVSASAQQVALGRQSIIEAVSSLKTGEYVWAPQLAPSGPTLLIVDVRTQRALLYRNGIPIAATTISTGKPGSETPTGAFTILEKQVEHYSRTYDNAPMPYMQRLTWKGVALHAGKLPGYPASHGCIRLPAGFAKLLYGVTRIGMTVAVTDRETVPRIAPTPEIALAGIHPGSVPEGVIEWHPSVSPSGPVSIVVSAADHRAFVLRNGVVIGSGPVTIEGPAAGTWAYQLSSAAGQERQWIRVELAHANSSDPVPISEWQRFRAPEDFKKLVASVIAPGTTIIVTADSVHPNEAGKTQTILDAGS